MSSNEPSQTKARPFPKWIALCIGISLIFCAWRLMPLLAPTVSASPSPSIDESLTVSDWDLAMRELDEKKTTAAASYIVRSMGNKALQPQRSLLQGRLFLEAGKLASARQTFSEALSSSTYAPLAQFWLGAASYAMTDTHAAESHWLQALEQRPDDTGVHRSLSMLYYDRGAIDRALHHLKSVATLDPKDARPLRLLGLIHKDYERYGEAADFYRQALARGLVVETREQVQAELVECLLKTREYEEGLKVLQDTAMTYANIALKAECLVGLGRSSEAAVELDDLLQRDPKHFAALLCRAGIYMEQREYPQAIAMLRRAVELKPADYLAHFRLAQSLRGDGQADLADSEAARADEIKVMRERFSKLHQDANEKPNDAEVRYELGQLAEQLDMRDLAVTWYRAALDLQPEHVGAGKRVKEMQ